MADGKWQAEIVGSKIFAFARLRKGTRRLSENLQRMSLSIMDIQVAFDHIHLFLDDQHRHFQDLIARNEDVERFCSRCQKIMEGNDPDQMIRERDWLIAGYRKRNADRRPWLDRLGLGQ